ncbi:hypothetical protein [Nocardioides acrostichi]|uniref:Uncharacterized protein n=1 Tax=Nocardioides acrostichi TaxID=2784339 RepID=A0A930V1Z6_9ACTN|nr:hypothetical protein [Nocardioides acrostichi]MBF4163932.1 hypothetical protein [Nocardioides acrostichi]
MPDPLPHEQDAHLRALLAGARHREPMPAEVVDRLDGVLARLAAGELGPPAEPVPDSPPASAAVVDLGRRRRRRVGALLAAAAVVLVVGAGIGQLVRSGVSSGDDSASSAAADRDSSLSESAQSPDARNPQDLASSESLLTDGSGAAGGEAGRIIVLEGALPAVTDDGFATTASRVRQRLGARNAASSASDSAAPRASREWQGCAPADWGKGRLVAVRYDGGPAVLAFRPAVGEIEVVDLLQCGTAAVLRTATLQR